MSSRKYLKKRRQKKQQQSLILILIMGGGVGLVVGAIISAAITSSRVNLKPRQITIPEYTQAAQYGIRGLGDPSAPVVITEYSDYSCSHCGNFATETKKLLEREYILTGVVALEYHTVGWVTERPAVLQATEAAYCAGEQGSFWQFHDLIFANQRSLFVNPAADVSRTMNTFAEMLELDMDAFKRCVAERPHRDLIDADRDAANELEVTGTPTFFINGVILRGNQPYENFRQAIEDALVIGN